MAAEKHSPKQGSGLGRRIAIIGWSSTGKSTLARNLGERLNIPATHLDAIHHAPNSNWEPRPRQDFADDHDAIVAQQEWIIEGNYTRLWPQRFANADTVVHIQMNRFGCLYRFVRRYFNYRGRANERIGVPPGLIERFNWEMVWWILQPKCLSKSRRQKSRASKVSLQSFQGNLIEVRSFAEINALLETIDQRSA